MKKLLLDVVSLAIPKTPVVRNDDPYYMWKRRFFVFWCL